MRVHRSRRAPIIDYRCGHCRRVFNAFTGSALHDNTLEGLWTGLRNFLRPFRGVSKKYLYQYVALFEWGYNIKRAILAFLRAILGVESDTKCPT